MRISVCVRESSRYGKERSAESRISTTKRLRQITNPCVRSLLVLGVVLGEPAPCWSETNGLPATACEGLSMADLTSLDEAPTEISDVRLVDSDDDRRSYCQVRGYVWPQVGFQMLLPVTGWNGKFIELGCGGACGMLPEPTRGYNGVGSCPLHRGYACIFSDLGHEGYGHNGRNGLWAYNNPQAQNDFGYRATHVVAVVGKAITRRYYSRPPDHSYFDGCSLGSQQGLVEAQRFPGDFDGIIGGGVWIGDTTSSMDFIWGARSLRGANGRALLSPADMQRVHEAVLGKCDLDDGVKDGLIGNPLSCKFDPAELGCATSVKPGCLTNVQVDALKKVYAGPMTSSGVKLSAGGPAPGSELEWVVEPGKAAGAGGWIMSDGAPAGAEEWATQYFRWLVRPPGGQGWNVANLDFDRDYKRFANGAKDSSINEANPDLRKFKHAGGKLLLYIGWKEWSDPRKAIDYYETVERTMGGPGATRDFFRLFIIPGSNHCGTGEGAWAVDYLTYMENWVERGQTPDRLIGAHVPGSWDEIAKLRFPLGPTTKISFTRPIYPLSALGEVQGPRGSKQRRELQSRRPLNLRALFTRYQPMQRRASIE